MLRSSFSIILKRWNHRKQEGQGVSHTIVKKTWPFSVYKNTSDTDKTVRREITIIRPFNQQLFTTSTMKDCLTSYYDKVKMLDKNNCEPFGLLQA
jgi:hypothetical protein